MRKGPTGIVPGSQYVPRRALEAARHKLNQFNQRARKEAAARFGGGLMQSEEARRWHRERLEQFRKDNPALFEEMAKLDEPWEAAKIPLTGDIGTATIVHFDIVHGRHSANVTDESRHMVKFLFTRDRDPVGPSWTHGGSPWPEDEDPLAPVWHSMWDWHRGAASSHAVHGNCIRDLGSGDDRVALGAAYSLGMAAARGESGLAPLFDAFLTDNVPLRSIAAYGLVAAGTNAAPRLAAMVDAKDAKAAVRALDLLGDIGPPAAVALPAVLQAIHHEDPNVRRYSVEAAGTIAQGTPVGASKLLAPLQDEDALVRRNAATAAARLARNLTNPDVLVPALTENLYFWHHHVRGWSIEALAATPQRQCDPSRHALPSHHPLGPHAEIRRRPTRRPLPPPHRPGAPVALRRKNGPLEGRHSAFPSATRTAAFGNASCPSPSRSRTLPEKRLAALREGRMPSLQRPVHRQVRRTAGAPTGAFLSPVSAPWKAECLPSRPGP